MIFGATFQHLRSSRFWNRNSSTIGPHRTRTSSSPLIELGR